MEALGPYLFWLLILRNMKPRLIIPQWAWLVWQRVNTLKKERKMNDRVSHFSGAAEFFKQPLILMCCKTAKSSRHFSMTDFFSRVVKMRNGGKHFLESVA